MNEPFYVYVAGPMSGTAPEYLANCARLSLASRDLMDAGFCTINPAADMLEGLMRDDLISDQRYKDRSMDLLRLLESKRGAVFVVAWNHRDGRPSEGVAAEVEEAYERGISVTDDLESLKALRSEWCES